MQLTSSMCRAVGSPEGKARGMSLVLVLWNIEVVLELDAVPDIGESRLLRSPFLQLETLVGVKVISVDLLMFPNCDRSPALGCAQPALAPATDHPSGRGTQPVELARVTSLPTAPTNIPACIASTRREISAALTPI